MIKRTIALVLLLSLALLTACGPDVPDPPAPAPYDPASAILPGTGSQIFYGDQPATHVDTDSFGADAEDLLAYAIAALKELGLDTDVQGIYAVPMGLAANDFSFDPFLIDTASDDCDQLLPMMSVLHDEDGYCAFLGAYHKDMLNGKADQDYLQSLFDAAYDRVLAELGFGKTDHTVFFNPVKFADKTFGPVSTEARELFDQLQKRYFNVLLCQWDTSEEGINVGGMYMQPLLHEEIRHISDLQPYLEKAFTPEIAFRILENLDPQLYAEVNDKPYFAPIGVGGPMDLQDYGPKYACETENRLYMITEAKRVDLDDNMDITGTYYEEFLLTFVKVDGEWRCSRYADGIFGSY